MTRLIYVVEDEADLRDTVCRALEQYRFTVRGFGTGLAFRRALARERPAVCLVDLALPDMDGLALVRESGALKEVGVIVMTGRGELSDRVLGLEVGADDYIVKPFEPRELVARVHSLARRLDLIADAGRGDGERRARFAGRVFDPGALTLTRPDGDCCTLSAAEALVLDRFLRAPGKVLSRERLMDDGLAADWQPYDRSIDIRISRLRRKVEEDPKNPQIIRTVYGAGYLFAAPVQWLDD